MEHSQPMGSIIGFDAATLGAPGAVNRGRRSTDTDGSTFAEVYDLAAYARSGSRSAARVATPQPLQTLAPLAPVAAPVVGPLAPVAAPLAMDTADRLAADRLFSDLTTGGSWLRVSDDQSGTVVMRLHDAAGAPVRELSITELQGDGPEVA